MVNANMRLKVWSVLIFISFLVKVHFFGLRLAQALESKPEKLLHIVIFRFHAGRPGTVIVLKVLLLALLKILLPLLVLLLFAHDGFLFRLLAPLGILLLSASSAPAQ
jgi:hypothetical protein